MGEVDEGGFYAGDSYFSFFFLRHGETRMIDFRCAINSTTVKAIRRSYSHILDPRLENMVSELSGELFDDHIPIKNTDFLFIYILRRFWRKIHYNRVDLLKLHWLRLVLGLYWHRSEYSKAHLVGQQCMRIQVWWVFDMFTTCNWHRWCRICITYRCTNDYET